MAIIDFLMFNALNMDKKIMQGRLKFLRLILQKFVSKFHMTLLIEFTSIKLSDALVLRRQITEQHVEENLNRIL